MTLREHGDAYVPDRFLTAADLGQHDQDAANQTVMLDSVTGEPFPNGTLASRFSASPVWADGTLTSAGVDPVLTLYGSTARPWRSNCRASTSAIPKAAVRSAVACRPSGWASTW